MNNGIKNIRINEIDLDNYIALGYCLGRINVDNNWALRKQKYGLTGHKPRDNKDNKNILGD